MRFPSLHGCDHWECQLVFTIWLAAVVFWIGTWCWALWVTRARKS